jgi:hypothetical protein
MWDQGLLPQELNNANIFNLYKRKGNRQSCDNHRGISLLSHAGKVLARILLNRLLRHLESHQLLPESQCGFRAGRGTADMIFAVRQLQEKCQEQNRPLYLTFVDLTKAFDTVCRDGLWKVMKRFGCPPAFVRMVRLFHEGMNARVSDQGELSDPFPVTNGVKQGCVLAPTLFSMVFSAMLAHTDAPFDVSIRHRMDGGLFNLRRLQAKTKVKMQPVREFLFADDCALGSSSESTMQEAMDSFATACDNFGLTISTQKTEVMHQPAPGMLYIDPAITVNGASLKNTDKFVYLGSTINQACNIDDKVDLRISKASQSFGRLRKTVWHHRGLKMQTKPQVYKAVILTILLYACETWTIYQRHAKKLSRFHLNCLRKILQIRWQDKIPDTDVLCRAKLPNIHTMLKSSQLRWAGHVARMEGTRLPKILLYGELSTGKRARDGPKKRYKDSLKISLKDY